MQRACTKINYEPQYPLSRLTHGNEYSCTGYYFLGGRLDFSRLSCSIIVFGSAFHYISKVKFISELYGCVFYQQVARRSFHCKYRRIGWPSRKYIYIYFNCSGWWLRILVSSLLYILRHSQSTVSSSRYFFNSSSDMTTTGHVGVSEDLLSL